MGIKPIVTEFKKDGNFISTYYSLEGDMINESVGSWEMVGDSLIMTQEDQASYYYVKVTGMEATFIGYLDWDGDSIKDDLYSGVQQKLMIE